MADPVKALLGWMQMGLLVAGLVALFSGRWLVVLGAWALAGLVGLAGNRLVRGVEGVSSSGRDAMIALPRAIDLLRRGEYRAATGMSRSAVTDFRMGGDRNFLPIALTIHAVTLTATRDTDGASKALLEASRLLDTMPPARAAEVMGLRQVHAHVRRELRSGVPNPSRFVDDFLAFNDAA
jgi:hypothetical protein